MIVLAVLAFTASDYPFVIFKPSFVFVDIGGIDDYRCFSFLFMIMYACVEIKIPFREPLICIL